MTLKEKFDDFTYYNPFGTNSENRVEREENNIACEQIADEFAIGFAEWLSKKERTKFQCLSYCKKTIMWFTSKKGLGATTKELLEIYKKEKGL